jgi:hypothetical protein
MDTWLRIFVMISVGREKVIYNIAKEKTTLQSQSLYTGDSDLSTPLIKPSKLCLIKNDTGEKVGPPKLRLMLIDNENAVILIRKS